MSQFREENRLALNNYFEILNNNIVKGFDKLVNAMNSFKESIELNNSVNYTKPKTTTSFESGFDSNNSNKVIHHSFSSPKFQDDLQQLNYRSFLSETTNLNSHFNENFRLNETIQSSSFQTGNFHQSQVSKDEILPPFQCDYSRCLEITTNACSPNAVAIALLLEFFPISMLSNPDYNVRGLTPKGGCSSSSGRQKKR